MKYTKELHDNFRSSIDSNNIADNPFWAKVTALLDEIDRQDAEIAELQDSMCKISDWCRAYPLDIFEEPQKEDWEKAHKILAEHGMNMTCFNTASMRHVTNGIVELIRGEAK